MDAARFDAILRSLTLTPARRHVLRLLAGSTLGLLAVEARPAAAKKKGGKKKGKNNGSGGGGRDCPECPEAPCVPNCEGKTCGPDGCGGLCGDCTKGTCRNGTCDCSGNTDTEETEFCGGDCVEACSTDESRNPFTCACCIKNGEPSNTGSCAGFPNDCCSQSCAPDLGGTILCSGSAGVCQFDAQCASGDCGADGACQ